MQPPAGMRGNAQPATIQHSARGARLCQQGPLHFCQHSASMICLRDLGWQEPTGAHLLAPSTTRLMAASALLAPSASLFRAWPTCMCQRTMRLQRPSSARWQNLQWHQLVCPHAQSQHTLQHCRDRFGNKVTLGWQQGSWLDPYYQTATTGLQPTTIIRSCPLRGGNAFSKVAVLGSWR